MPIHGIDEALAGLKDRNYKMGILTSNSHVNVCRFLQKNELEVFEYVFSGVSIFGKTRVIKNLLRKAKVSPDEAVYVGDETRDIEAAKSAGIRVVSVSWGFNSREILLSQKPDYLLDHPTELGNLFVNSLSE